MAIGETLIFEQNFITMIKITIKPFDLFGRENR